MFKSTLLLIKRSMNLAAHRSRRQKPGTHHNTTYSIFPSSAVVWGRCLLYDPLQAACLMDGCWWCSAFQESSPVTLETEGWWSGRAALPLAGALDVGPLVGVASDERGSRTVWKHRCTTSERVLSFCSNTHRQRHTHIYYIRAIHRFYKL